MKAKKESDHLASRLGELRRESFGDGDDGLAALARGLGLPARIWENYEHGVTIPGWALLLFIDHTGADPHWLLTGEGDRYLVRPAAEGRAASR
jgi:hypothetical protein